MTELHPYKDPRVYGLGWSREVPKYHIDGSHMICEDGKPVIVSSLWKCIQRVRQMESEMVRYYEHSDLTIMPCPVNVFGGYDHVQTYPLKQHSNYDEQPISRFK